MDAIHQIHSESPISSLPPELLSKILVFAIRADDFVVFQFGLTGLSHDTLLAAGFGIHPKWSAHVQLRLVCTTWRQTALACPEYWTSTPFLHLTGCSNYPKMLARTGAAPLTLRLNRVHASYLQVGISEETTTPRSVSVAQLQELFDPTRLQQLRFYAGKNLQTQVLAHFPIGETPLLDTLTLSPLVPASSRGGSPAVSRFLQIPVHLVNLPRPKFHSLHLAWCNSPWTLASSSTRLYSNLVHLTLARLQ